MAGNLAVVGGLTDKRAMAGRAKKVSDVFLRFQAPHDAWAKEAAQEEDFFYGRQWTKEQITKLEQRGMAPLVINRIMPVILQEVAILTAKEPQFKALPREDGDVKVAAMCSDLLAYIYHISNGASEILQAGQDYFTMGAGYLHAFVDPIDDDGRGEVKFENLPPWDVYPDPNSRKLDLSDARCIIISRIVDRESLAMVYPSKISAIRGANAAGAMMSSDRPNTGLDGDSPINMAANDIFDSETEAIRLYICYEKMLIPHVQATDITTGMRVVMPQMSYTGAFDNLDSVEIERFYRVRIRRTVSIGTDTMLEQNVLPIDRYPVIPAFLYHNRTPFPKGDVSVIKGMQQEINKRRSIMIHNAALMGNMRMVAEHGAISNEDEWYEEGTVPGFILKYKKGYQAPVPMQSQAIPAAWIQLEQEAKGDLEYAASVFAHQMGSSQDAPDTYRALLTMEEAGQRKIRHKMAHINMAMRNLGSVCLQLAQALYTQPKVMRIVGENNMEMREIFINKTQVDILTGRIQRNNDITVGRYDVVVETGSSMPTNRMALLNLYMELFQLGAIDHEELLKKTDVVDRAAVLARIGQVNQLRQQQIFMEEQAKDLEGLNQTMRRQLQQAMVKLEAFKLGEQSRDQFRQTTGEQKLARARIEDETKNFRGRLALLEQKVALDGRIINESAKIEAEKQRAAVEVRNAAARRNSGK